MSPEGKSESRAAKHAAQLAEMEQFDFELDEPDLESDHSCESTLSDGWAPKHTCKELPLPAGIRSYQRWGDTICSLPKVRSLDLTFRQIVLKNFEDRELRKYLSWLTSKFDTEKIRATEVHKGRLQYVHEISTPAVDLCLYMALVDTMTPLKRDRETRMDIPENSVSEKLMELWVIGGLYLAICP